MKRLVALLLLTAACHAAPPSTALTGADSPHGVVDKFLASANAQDLQAMSAVWGDERGPARDRFPRQEAERQMLIMVCLVKHDGQKIGDPVRVENSRLAVPVDLTLGKNKATSKFIVAQGPSSRWYVQDLDLKVLQANGFCASAKGTGKP